MVKLVTKPHSENTRKRCYIENRCWSETWINSHTSAHFLPVSFSRPPLALTQDKGRKIWNHFGFELLFKGKHAQYSSHIWSLRTFMTGCNYGHHGATLKGKCLIKTFSVQPGTVYVLFSVVSCLASSCVNDFLALKSERNLQHKMREGLLLVVVRGFRTFSFKCFF